MAVIGRGGGRAVPSIEGVDARSIEGSPRPIHRNERDSAAFGRGAIRKIESREDVV
jgi:hypothetical protein